MISSGRNRSYTAPAQRYNKLGINGASFDWAGDHSRGSGEGSA